MRMDEGFNSKEQAIASRSNPDFRPVERLSKGQRIATPIAFRDLLISIAKSALDSRHHSPNLHNRFQQLDLPLLHQE
jgi:hypothetical protein